MTSIKFSTINQPSNGTDTNFHKQASSCIIREPSFTLSRSSTRILTSTMDLIFRSATPLHPIFVSRKDVEPWSQYFANRKRRQPFEWSYVSNKDDREKSKTRERQRPDRCVFPATSGLIRPHNLSMQTGVRAETAIDRFRDAWEVHTPQWSPCKAIKLVAALV